MLSSTSRRAFLKNCGQLGVACAACGLTSFASAAEPAPTPAAPAKLPELHTLAYCGLTCDNRCQLFKATAANDVAAKKKVFDEWGLKAKYGREFDPEKVFCYGCKSPGKPRNESKTKCTVRACAIEREFDSCLQCKGLAACDKELWKGWPDFHKNMIKAQEAYVAAGAFALI